LKTLERRLKLLEKEGEGLSPAEIVQELSLQFNCTCRTIYKDFQKRAEWQPTLQQLGNQKDLILKVLNRYEQLYRLAHRKFLNSANESCQVAYLKLMMNLTGKVYETGIVPDMLDRLERIEDAARKAGLLE